MRNIHGYEIDPPTYGSNPDGKPTPDDKPTPDALPMAPMMSAPTGQDDEDPTFYGSLGKAFLLPLQGRGLQWLLMIAVVTMVLMFALVGAKFLFIFGIAIPFLVYAILLTLNARFFFAAFGATAVLEGEMAPPPTPGSNNQVPMLLPGFILMLWTFTALVPLGMWMSQNRHGLSWGNEVGPQQAIIGWALLLIPYFIWPTALVRMTSGSIIDMWNVPSILMSITKEPIKYTLVVVFGTIAGLVPLVIAGFVGSARLGIVGGLISLFASCVAMAYSHGVMGAMMGYLAAENPSILPKSARGEA